MVETVSRDVRRRRRRLLALSIVLGLAGLLAVNTVSVLRQTAPAVGDHIVRLEAGDLRVIEDGPRSAPALLLIHGDAGSLRWWDPVVPRLSADHHIVRIDLLGYGESAKPDTGYDMPAQGRRVAAVLDRLGIDRAIVVGYELGGVVATALAEQRPGLVAALALIDTAPSDAAVLDPTLGDRLMPVPVIGEVVWRLRAHRGMTYRSFTESPKESARYRFERPLPNRLAGLGLPLLVIYGAEDARLRTDSARDYSSVPGARVETLPGALADDPQPALDLVRGFSDAVGVRR
ncbi:alpha/beta fold hydrolase [Nocardia jejuensis]|uniref:alpha/beta fold hydrolase n=1 Tax=Nocardia jejuensis TaxID=328049 RepID=UPI000A0522D4|nr:alpha/beta fold hydrolase [Nocardia jejuensis]